MFLLRQKVCVVDDLTISRSLFWLVCVCVYVICFFLFFFVKGSEQCYCCIFVDCTACCDRLKVCIVGAVLTDWTVVCPPLPPLIVEMLLTEYYLLPTPKTVRGSSPPLLPLPATEFFANTPVGLQKKK